MTTQHKIRTVLASHSPKEVKDPHRRHAAVAMILKQGKNDRGIDVLFMQRTEHDADPWSGNLAFPGGKIDEEDGNPLKAAIRETQEEIGVDLARADLIGQLDDIAGAYLPVTVSCYVFLLSEYEPEMILNEEVRETFWFPLKELGQPERHQTARVNWNNGLRLVPGIDLLGKRGPALWGITYRLVMQFLDLIDCDSGDCPDKT